MFSNLSAKADKNVAKLSEEDIKKLKQSEAEIRRRHAQTRAANNKKYKLDQQQREKQTKITKKKFVPSKAEMDMEWIKARTKELKRDSYQDDEKKVYEHDVVQPVQPSNNQKSKSCCIIS